MTLDSLRKVLVANRGEIACRVLRTCSRLGIPTVAIHSEADRHALHVRRASEAFEIGPPPARESYLLADRILEVARSCGADAVHPGYGFLSENAEFAEACEGAGIRFIGPPAAAIRAMGSKSAAKALMADAGVPLVPGYHGDDQTDERLAEEAAAIGFPVMLKASAGGGGKGMRVVADPDGFGDALASCRRESKAYFGDDRMLVERCVERPRHVEIQVFADSAGSVLHLFERDCSVQRRHQKVIEEAPAPGLSEEQREAMGRAAVDAARAVGYVGAGTVEFIVSPEGAFYFMEMNTRLHVEHPVTEMITGLDLVEWQLRVAAGEPLPHEPHELSIHGHSFEARIYAENPEKRFLPSVGRLARLDFPEASEHVRIDTGVESGDSITPHYDPMIAKLVVWDETRESALRRLRTALAGTRIVGVAHNVSFLGRVAAHPRFREGRVDTGLIDEESDVLLAAPAETSLDARVCAALGVVLGDREQGPSQAADPWSPWDSAGPFRLNARLRRCVELGDASDPERVFVEEHGDGFRVECGERSLEVSASLGADGRLEATIEGRRREAWIVPHEENRHVFLDGEAHVFAVVDRLSHAGGQSDAEASLRSPMPGTVISIEVEPGKRVRAGAPLLVLEAMKMEHAIKAPCKGVVKRFPFAVGDQVPEGAELVEFEPS